MWKTDNDRLVPQKWGTSMVILLSLEPAVPVEFDGISSLEKGSETACIEENKLIV